MRVGEVEVELWTTEPIAVKAVRKTVRALLVGADLVERDGKFYVPEGYVAWACARQGYVKRALTDHEETP